QPRRDPRQPRTRCPRAVQDSTPDPRAYGARPLHRLCAAGAARGARHGAAGHQPRAHEPALPRAHGADDAPGRDRDTDDRIPLDPTGDQDRGVAVTLLLPLLAFLFASLLVAAGAMALS